MARILGTMSDRLLSAILRERGACVPEHGQLCPTCKSGYRYRYNCNGYCTSKTAIPC
ncbi:hypothetical protein GCM10009678_44150 [Actinomadura kijaniata]|uniref:Uncharacterized protein n=1 Tax=Actinomadura namibiensis TaxID=182080 RepID=A0A7W3LR95_ACTNM|nr:hypothetical protein [Actinomadura namibiensis]MBA8952824.1 hypothetical protein [Actinomadura namibiensis]